MKVLVRFELLWVSETGISDLVEGVTGVGDELTKEDFFVGIKGVDDQAHKLGDFSLESERFGWSLFLVGISLSLLSNFGSHLDVNSC